MNGSPPPPYPGQGSHQGLPQYPGTQNYPAHPAQNYPAPPQNYPAYPPQQYPAYPPQQYPVYPPQQYPVYPRRYGTNGFAVASLLFGIVGGVLLSAIFGFTALSQIRRRGQKGRGLAIAGLVLSGVWMCVFIAMTIVDMHSAG
jgi:Domain of unknown function (DUF4190)